MRRRRFGSFGRMSFTLLGLVCFLLSLSFPATSQVRILVYGRVFLPNNQPALHLVVNISGQNGFRGSTNTDGRGGFRFEGVPRSIYSVSVNLPADAEYYAEPISVDASTEGSSFMVDIFLRNPLVAKRKEKLDKVISAREADIPKEARKAFDRAQKLREQKKFEAALTELDKAVGLYPNYFRAISERGIVQINLERLPDALQNFNRALEIFPEYEPALSGAGYALLSLGKYEDSATFLEKAIQLDSSHTQNLVFLGIANLAMRRWARSQEVLERALKLDAAGAVTAHMYLADVFAGQHLYARAADELHTYLHLNPEAPNADRLRQREKYFRSQKAP
jgi:tetratricopeptide (TPR) repeat protein